MSLAVKISNNVYRIRIQMMTTLIFDFPRIVVSISFSNIINALKPGHNGCHFADDIFQIHFLINIVFILLQISLQFVS